MFKYEYESVRRTLLDYERPGLHGQCDIPRHLIVDVVFVLQLKHYLVVMIT